MDTGKHGNSDASSQESDNQPEKSNEEATGVGRSYECTFCKRGFTNAQALGGHMNIHRKDKAKAKHKNQEETSNKSNIPRYTSSQVVSNADHQQQRGYNYGVVGGEMMSNYQVYLPSSNPNFQTGNYLPLWRPDRLDGRVAANLSLRIGISPPAGGGDGEEGDVDSNVKESDVDLELRLGHQP